MHIVIAGNIGSGKTTLTEMLAKHYHWEPKYEQVAFNPYLDDYYKDIERWSFPMEVFFLKERFRDLMQMEKDGKDTIQDRSIYEGVYVFATNNHNQGNLSDRDFETYMELFSHMTNIVKFPDLMIYLRASVPHLVANIQKRGRNCEQAIQLEYLKGLNEAELNNKIAERKEMDKFPGLQVGDATRSCYFQFLVVCAYLHVSETDGRGCSLHCQT